MSNYRRAGDAASLELECHIQGNPLELFTHHGIEAGAANDSFNTANDLNDAKSSWPVDGCWSDLAPSTSGLNTSESGGTSGTEGQTQRKRVGRPRVNRPAATKKRGDAQPTRGPKPKYVFQSNEEAADARRERNRQAAIESYYKRRQRVQQLETEISRLTQENAALEELHKQITSGAPHSLLSPSMEGVQSWLNSHCTSSL